VHPTRESHNALPTRAERRHLAQRGGLMSSSSPAPISILFVDSNSEDCAHWIRQLALSSSYYLSTTVENGRSALKLLESEKFDCVVLEMVLPDMSGFEVLSNLSPIASKPTVAIVVLTKLVSAACPIVAKTNGAQAYLVKSKTSGGELDLAIRTAIWKVSSSDKESLVPS